MTLIVTFENDKRWKPLLAKLPVPTQMSEADFSPAPAGGGSLRNQGIRIAKI